MSAGVGGLEGTEVDKGDAVAPQAAPALLVCHHPRNSKLQQQEKKHNML